LQQSQKRVVKPEVPDVGGTQGPLLVLWLDDDMLDDDAPDDDALDELSPGDVPAELDE